MNVVFSKRPCHIPWAHIEALKIKDRDGNEHSPVPLPERRAKMYCYNNEEDFKALPLEIYSWVFYKDKTAKGGNVHGCYGEDDGSLTCEFPRKPNKWNQNPLDVRHVKNPWGRIAYHLFSSIMPAHVSKIFKAEDLEAALSSDLVLGELFRRTLGVDPSIL